MVVFKFNPAETGLRKTLREYEEIALRYIWSVGDEGAGSGKTWIHVNEELGEGKSISKASIIFYLNRMVDEGVLGFRDATGKGGHHRIYITQLDESGCARAWHFIEISLRSDMFFYSNNSSVKEI